MVENRAITELPSSISYYYFVSRDSVRLEFLVSELNDMDIMACDIGNVYLMLLVDRTFGSQQVHIVDHRK